MRPYPLAKRLAVLAACDAGAGTREVASQHTCSESWVRRVKQWRRQPWKGIRFTRRRRRAPLWTPYADQIEALKSEGPELTLLELKSALGTNLSLQTLSRALRRLGL